MRLAFVGLWLLLALGPAIADDAGAAFAPASSIAGQLDVAGVLVSWKPGEELADAYRVYGLSGDIRTRLAEWSAENTGEASVMVPNGYAEYGVVGIRGGVESPLVLSTLVDLDDPPCLSVVIDVPPRYAIDCLDSPVGARVKLMVRVGGVEILA